MIKSCKCTMYMYVSRVIIDLVFCFFFFFSSRRRHTRLQGDWSSDVCSSDLILAFVDRSQHIWPTDSLFPEQQNRIIPLTASQYRSVFFWVNALKTSWHCNTAQMFCGEITVFSLITWLHAKMVFFYTIRSFNFAHTPFSKKCSSYINICILFW